ncbi:MAG TPA: glycosyltransferase family 2 protein [Thermoanaerobaculia bacterium]|nr:glycosyltransferase family 2 protein [Thermoanaerobaculia bacterium]
MKPSLAAAPDPAPLPALPAAAPAPLVSVVIPCLDEAETIADCVHTAWRGIAASGLPGEVLVVDNGSTDGTPEQAAAAGARVVHERRRGYGAAYLRGFREARGQYLVMGDGDGSYDFGEVPRFVAPLREGAADLVMGTRLKGTILPGAMPWSHRWIGNPILSGMLRIFYRTRISDSHCGMRAFSRAALERMGLRTTGMELASEIVVAALRSQLRLCEIPITYHPRGGVSKLNGLRDAWRHVRFMLLFSPSHLFLAPGLVLCAVGALLVALLAGGPRQLLGRVWDYHVLLFGCLAVVLGYNLVLFDLFAKSFSMAAGLAPPRHWLDRLQRGFTLEKGLLLGGLAFLAGAALEAKIFLDWVRSGYGALMAVRGIVIGMTAMVLGSQTAFASFLLGLTQLSRSEPRGGDDAG